MSGSIRDAAAQSHAGGQSKVAYVELVEAAAPAPAFETIEKQRGVLGVIDRVATPAPIRLLLLQRVGVPIDPVHDQTDTSSADRTSAFVGNDLDLDPRARHGSMVVRGGLAAGTTLFVG
jgi:hypothetical protein